MTDTTSTLPPPRLYHYTTRDRADEVRADLEEPGVYAEISHGQFGPGFYALDLKPGDDRDALRWECFEDSRSAHPMDGVLVLDSGLAVPQFLSQEGHIWLLPIVPRLGFESHPLLRSQHRD